MPRKPSNLLYGVDESPGRIALVLMGFQHISLMAIAFMKSLCRIPCGLPQG
jgi:hypothetical protein